jgi:hypothetical protein
MSINWAAIVPYSAIAVPEAFYSVVLIPHTISYPTVYFANKKANRLPASCNRESTVG